ncbi:MAG: hypothetical protein K0U98_08445 [Deltaproteobacteria bacterium]|nr:hypothetical protein [Deltaproteobacteria bacterium]
MKGKTSRRSLQQRRPFGVGLLVLVLVLVLGGLSPISGRAQEVLLEGGVQAGSLWCFPLASNPETYVYLPSRGQLAMDDTGRPRFSLIRYVAAGSEEASASAIEAAAGGGVLHFLVEYHTPEEEVAQALRELRRRTGKQELRLQGPVFFEKGQYTLVSSILSRSTSEGGPRVLAQGAAPVLEGGRLALSFALDAEASTLLLASLKQPTPDVSLAFDLVFRGQHPAYQAKLVVDWDQVSRHRSLNTGATYYWVGAQIELLLDELIQNGTIRLESTGSAEVTEALVDRAYSRLLDLLFQPIEPKPGAGETAAGPLEALIALFDPKRGSKAQKVLGFGGHLAFEAKEIRRQGTSVLSFQHRASDDRHHSLTVNLGDLYHRYGQDENLFRTVSLNDPSFQQRAIHIAVDGALQPELGESINHVTVSLRKRHGSGAETLRELVLYRDSVSESLPDLRLIYGWDGDADRSAWLDYEYRTGWSFQGGGAYRTPWTTQSDPVIHLYAPFVRRGVQAFGDGAALEAQRVRAVSLRLDTPFFGERRQSQLLFRPEEGSLDREIEVVLPRGEFGYRYSLTWIFEDGHRRERSGTDDSGVILLDEMPGGSLPTEPAPSEAAPSEAVSKVEASHRTTVTTPLSEDAL